MRALSFLRATVVMLVWVFSGPTPSFAFSSTGIGDEETSFLHRSLEVFGDPSPDNSKDSSKDNSEGDSENKNEQDPSCDLNLSNSEIRMGIGGGGAALSSKKLLASAVHDETWDQIEAHLLRENTMNRRTLINYRRARRKILSYPPLAKRLPRFREIDALLQASYEYRDTGHLVKHRGNLTDQMQKLEREIDKFYETAMRRSKFDFPTFEDRVAHALSGGMREEFEEIRLSKTWIDHNHLPRRFIRRALAPAASIGCFALLAFEFIHMLEEPDSLQPNDPYLAPNNPAVQRIREILSSE